MILITSSIGRLVDSPQRNELIVNTAVHVNKNRFRPNRWPNHAVVGMTMAFEIR